MAYLVIAYPRIREKDYDKIQAYRRDHDELYFSVVEPHFTLVFPVYNMPLETFVSEIELQSKGFTSFEFVLRCAVVNKDVFSTYYHTFLIPEEGFSRFVRLHDQLYSQKLKTELCLDIDFMPHLGVGNSKDKWVCKHMVDKWNAHDVEIAGRIETLSIIKFDGGRVKELSKIQLE